MKLLYNVCVYAGRVRFFEVNIVTVIIFLLVVVVVEKIRPEPTFSQYFSLIRFPPLAFLNYHFSEFFYSFLATFTVRQMKNDNNMQKIV